MMIGYARISTTDQTLDLQLDALQKAGCAKIFTDTASGAKAERKGLEEAISYVRAGDTIVVWRLDDLADPFNILSRRLVSSTLKASASKVLLKILIPLRVVG